MNTDDALEFKAGEKKKWDWEMNNFWANYKGLKCVVLCAGEGRRILPDSLAKPKVMIEIRNKPILLYVVEYWKRYTDDFIFVVGYKKEQVIEFTRQLPINSEFVEQKELRGIAHGVLCARGLVSDRFIVVLGDCIYRGEFCFPQNMEQGIGVWKTNSVEDIKRSYSVETKNNLVCRVEEKPKEVLNYLCGTGFYFFDKRVFGYIEIAKPSKLRNEVEITDVIQDMINAGEQVTPVTLRGDYLNITYPEDLQRADEIL